MNGLPEITSTRGKPLLSAAKLGTQSDPSFLEDSGLELRGSSISRPSTASSVPQGSGWLANSPSASARFSPSPPPGPARPRSSLATAARKSIEFVRVSKKELERNEEALSSLRSQAVQMQALIRRLQHFEQDYATVQSGCGRVAVALGCSLEEGVAASAIQDILLSRVNTLLGTQQQDTQKHEKCVGELEQCRAELAAAKVQLTSTEGHLKKARKQERHLETELQQAKGDLETLRQSCARTGATVESLRQQLAEAQGSIVRGQRESSSELTQLQTDMGRLKQEMTEKEDMVRGLEEQLSVVEEDRNSLKEMLSTLETMHADFCTQLALSLQTDSLDTDHLVSQVSGVVEESEELRLRCEALSGSIKTAELDSKASRETILRLVSEAKKQEKAKEEVGRLQSEVEEQRTALIASKQGRVVLQEQLTAAKDTMLALEQEIQAKEEKLSELGKSMDVYKEDSDSSKALIESVQNKYEELVDDLRVALSLQSSDTTTLLQGIRELTQTCSQQARELTEQQSLVRERESCIQSSQDCSRKLEQELKKERARLHKLEGEVGALEVVREGLTRDLEKSHTFSKKVAKALALDRGTAEILAGDFAQDAILMKAEQLAKQESDVMLSKQTAIYSLQRKLKACQQTLQSRELHMSLLQKKVESLEQSLKATSRRESEWEANLNKTKKVEKSLEKLQNQVEEQRKTILQLQSENSQLQKLKESSYQLERENVRLLAGKEELEHTCGKQKQQLAEARGQAKQRRLQSDTETEQLKTELGVMEEEVKRLKDREEKLSLFRTATERLLLSCQAESEDKDCTLSDYDLIATLESVIGSQKKHRDNVKCLEASLRQLELGFKTNYKDTLTILSSD